MNIPNTLTLIRLAAIPIFVVVFYLPYSWHSMATAAIFAKPVASVLQKLAKPVTKKVVKRFDQRLGRKEKRGSLQERRAAQRDRNAAIHDLRRALGR